MNKTREEFAGEQYSEGRTAVSSGGHKLLWKLATHITCMLSGTIEFPGPLWQRRVVPPDNREVVLDSFEDYLLLPAREGLHLESLFQLRSILLASKEGGEALTLVREEIPGFDEKCRSDKAAIAEAKGPTPEHGTNRHSRGYNITSRTHDRGDSAEYLIRRLLKEDRKDLVDKIIAGKLSASAAGIEAGIKRPYRSVPIDGPVEAVTALLRVFSREQLLEALQEKEDV